ncbi:MAG: RDD family protein, partial [Ilumatobacteraceae bacterium]
TSDLLLALWAFTYFAYPLSIGGRTPGMGLVGLEVVRADGHPLDRRHAVIRVLALALSIVLFWLAVILVLVRRDRRTIHDLIGDTAVVYSWDARGARLRVLARRDHVEPG